MDRLEGTVFCNTRFNELLEKFRENNQLATLKP